MQLRDIIRASIDHLATEEEVVPPVEQLWKDAEGHALH